MKTSVLTKSQKKVYPSATTCRSIRLYGKPHHIRAFVRYDDECGNGHNTFAITGEYWEQGKSRDSGGGGCCHDEIAKAFPELAPFIKWHLCSSNQPLHYIANTIYHAGNRDCHGLLAGEFRQFKSHGPRQNDGVEGVPNWELVFPEGMKRDIYANEKPAPVVLEWKPYGRTGEGKARDFDAARSCAIWPEATDEQLSLPAKELEALLMARHPALMAEFEQAVESLGFTY